MVRRSGALRNASAPATAFRHDADDLHGTAIGLVPVRVMQDELERGRVKLIPVSPEVPAHRVSICYQISEFGPGLAALVDLTRALVAQHKLFI
jgi:DNA-binding transcriptional LysR family regulator